MDKIDDDKEFRPLNMKIDFKTIKLKNGSSIVCYEGIDVLEGYILAKSYDGLNLIDVNGIEEIY